MFDLDSVQLFLLMFSALGTFIATMLQAWYKKQERDERRRGARYEDIDPIGFDLLEKAYRMADCRSNRVLDFDEVLDEINRSTGLTGSERSAEQMNARSALETLKRTGCLKKCDGSNVYVMEKTGLRVREYHREKRWWKVWMRPPL